MTGKVGIENSIREEVVEAIEELKINRPLGQDVKQ